MVDWWIGQGIFVALLLGVALLAVAGLAALIRAARHPSEKRAAMRTLGRAFKDFLMLVGAATIVIPLVTTIYFLLIDAPQQVYVAQTALAKTKSDDDSIINGLKSELNQRNKRKEIRIALGRFAFEGAELLSASGRMTENELGTAAVGWENRIKQYMLSEMDESYYDRLLDVSDISARPQFNTNPGIAFSIWNTLNNLQKIIREYD